MHDGEAWHGFVRCIQTVTKWENQEWHDLNFNDTGYNVGWAMGIYNQQLFIGVDSGLQKSRLYRYELEPVDTASSVEKPGASAINMYPNPLKHILHIQAQSLKDGDYQFILTNSLGQTVIRQPLTEANISLSVDELGKGVYVGFITNSHSGEVIHREQLVKP